jgi:hypothetical protein
MPTSSEHDGDAVAERLDPDTRGRPPPAALWTAARVSNRQPRLGFGPDLRLYPVLCVHVARLSWLHELLVDGVPVLDAAALRPALQVTRQALTAEQVTLVAGQVRAGFRPAA